MVSLIQSNFSLWGVGIAVEGGGFVLHNRGALVPHRELRRNALSLLRFFGVFRSAEIAGAMPE